MNVALNVLNNKELFLTKNKFIFNKDDEYQNTNLRPTYKSYLVEKENFAISRNECAISYAYDDLGRLLAVNYFKEQTHNYEYDYRGYLISDNNLSIEYDNNGNILKKGDVSYTYDPVIKDRLIKVGNETIEYDTNNPLIPTKYLDKRLKFEGKRLKEVTKNNKTSYLYYDEEGYLIKKIDGNNKVTNFVYENGNLLYLKKDNDELDFFYDENNFLYGFILNKSNIYYYLRDIFNNILGILDCQGEIIVSYEYDAFGNIIKTEDLSSIQLGILNPFKYKGYYYDEEIELYYLISRFYDANIGRFISPDSIDYLKLTSINGLNLYIYCGNDPLNRIDVTGHDWNWTTFGIGVGFVVTAILAIALSATTFGAGIPLAMAIVAGITMGAGILTGINGIATIVEAGTNFNFVRDGVFNNVGLSDDIYDAYAGVTDVIADVGIMILGFYHTTGQYKAAKASQQYLGKGYTKASKGRWVSADGYRQVRWDTTHHMYKGKPSPVHFNWYEYKYPISAGVRNQLISDIHIWLKWFSYYI